MVHTLLNLHLVLEQLLLECYNLLCCLHFEDTEKKNLEVITTLSTAGLEELTFKFSEAAGA